MRRTNFSDWPCPVARTADLVGDWWTPLVLRNVFFGQHRFDELQASLNVSRPVLAQRLNRLVAEGMLDKVQYEQHPPRHEYMLTEKGIAFGDVLAAMWRWGTDWLDPDETIPIRLVDRETRKEVRPRVIDETTGDPLDLRATRIARRR